MTHKQNKNNIYLFYTLEMRRKTQKGGIIIKKNTEEALNFFIENAAEFVWLKATGASASGVIFECTLKDDVESPYEMIRSTDFKSPVRKILVKLVGIDSEVFDVKSDDYAPKIWDTERVRITPKKLEQEEVFKSEINIQTDIFLKTISYLNPLCPAPIYASIKKDTSDALSFISKLKTAASESAITNALLDGISENIEYGSIPYLGILGMEIADGYKTFYDFYQDKTSKDDIRKYENMIRLKVIDLALKTGYSQGDFHVGNMLVNPKLFTGYYNGILGNVLIIDFGYANKIPQEKLRQIKQLVSKNNYVEALKIFYTLERSDGLPLNEYPNFYGWLSYDYDNVSKKKTKYWLTTTNEIELENQKLINLKQAEESATDARIAFYNSDAHSRERDVYPLLPLSNAIKNSMFEGLLTGGKKINKTRIKKRSRSYTRRNNIQ